MASALHLKNAERHVPAVVNGHQLIDLYAQLVEVLETRIGLRHSRYLARPQLDSSGELRWWCDLSAPAQSMTSLTGAQRADLQLTARRIDSDILSLAGRLRTEGEAGQRYADLMEALIQTCGHAELFSVRGQPVCAGWGLRKVAQSASRTNAASIPGPPPVSPLVAVTRPLAVRAWPWRWMAKSSATALALAVGLGLLLSFGLELLTRHMESNVNDLSKRNEDARKRLAQAGASNGMCGVALPGAVGTKGAPSTSAGATR